MYVCVCVCVCTVVELLILSHDCFSLTCNMEGIVRVLQAARHLSHTHLAHSDSYGLLVSMGHLGVCVCVWCSYLSVCPCRCVS